jgi:hypothetical protein
MKIIVICSVNQYPQNCRQSNVVCSFDINITEVTCKVKARVVMKREFAQQIRVNGYRISNELHCIHPSCSCYYRLVYIFSYANQNS